MKSFGMIISLFALTLCLMVIAMDQMSPMAHRLTVTGGPFVLAMVLGAKLLGHKE